MLIAKDVDIKMSKVLKSPIRLIGVGLTLLALLLHVIGYATPYWMTRPSRHTLFGFHSIGLWQYCEGGSENTVCESSILDGAFIAVYACASFGLLALLMSAFFGLLYVCQESKRTKGIAVVIAMLNLLAGLTIFAGVGTFAGVVGAANGRFTPGYSLILCCVAAGLALVAMVVFFVAKTTPSEGHTGAYRGMIIATVIQHQNIQY